MEFPAGANSNKLVELWLPIEVFYQWNLLGSMCSPNSGRPSNDAVLHDTFSSSESGAKSAAHHIWKPYMDSAPWHPYNSYVGEDAGPRIQEHEINSSLYIVISVILKLVLVLF